jgi:molybdopterin-guanine dinucleotide biosynthesis protein B
MEDCGNGDAAVKIFGIIGSSGSGKTQLIERLIAEFHKRGRRVAVLKHCPHGFDLDREGKDSHRFLDKGASGVGLAGPGQTAFLHRTGPQESLAVLAQEKFYDADIILIEGGKNSPGYPKLLVLAAGEPLEREAGLEEVAAVVAENKQPWSRRVFAPEEVSAMADFIEKHDSGPAAFVTAEVDGVAVPMNPFVQKVFEQVVLGLVTSLKDVGQDPQRIVLTVTRSGHVGQKH